jgi:spore coat polysaccharide biosynthesis protein SpsF
MDIMGRTMLAQVVDRTRRARLLHTVVVATTTLPADDAIVSECAALDVAVLRGPELDVLTRYLCAAQAHNAELIVRITADCPLIDPEIIDLHVATLLARWRDADFVTNMIKQTYPLGLAVEAMPIDVLERMSRLSVTAHLREHVTTLAYERPELFLIDHICHTEDLSHMRWTVDTREDLELVRRIYSKFSDNRFAWSDGLRILANHPEWTAINTAVRPQPA